MESNAARPDSGHCDPEQSTCVMAEQREGASNLGATPASELLAQTVRERIVFRAGRHLRALDILVHPGFVEVTGIAHSFYAKQLVTHVLLDGMPQVEIRNSLAVLPLRPCKLDD